MDEFLGEIVLEGQVTTAELEQAKAGLLAADDAYNAADYRTAIAGYEQLMETWPQMGCSPGGHRRCLPVARSICGRTCGI